MKWSHDQIDSNVIVVIFVVVIVAVVAVASSPSSLPKEKVLIAVQPVLKIETGSHLHKTIAANKFGRTFEIISRYLTILSII